MPRKAIPSGRRFSHVMYLKVLRSGIGLVCQAHLGSPFALCATEVDSAATATRPKRVRYRRGSIAPLEFDKVQAWLANPMNDPIRQRDGQRQDDASLNVASRPTVKPDLSMFPPSVVNVFPVSRTLDILNISPWNRGPTSELSTIKQYNREVARKCPIPFQLKRVAFDIDGMC